MPLWGRMFLGMRANTSVWNVLSGLSRNRSKLNRLPARGMGTKSRVHTQLKVRFNYKDPSIPYEPIGQWRAVADKFRKPKRRKDRSALEDTQDHSASNSQSLHDQIMACQDVDQLSQLCSREYRNFTIANTSTAFNLLGHFGKGADKYNEPAVRIAKAISKLALAQWDKMLPLHIRTILTAHARLRIPPNDELLEALNERALVVAQAFSPQDITNTLWAFAKFGYNPPKDLIESLEQQACKLIQNFDEQWLAQLMCAYAKMGASPGPEVARLVSEQVTLRARGLSAESVSNLVWAYGKMQAPSENQVLSALSKRAARVMGDMDGMLVANVVWGFAVLQFNPGQELFSDLCNQALAQPKKLEAQGVSDILFASVQLRLRLDEGDMQRLCGRLIKALHVCTKTELVEILQYLTELGYIPEALVVDGLRKTVYRHMDDFTQEESAIVLRAFDMMQIEQGFEHRHKKQNHDLITARTPKEVCSTVKSHLASFNSVNTATAMRVLGTMKSRGGRSFTKEDEDMCQKALSQLQERALQQDKHLQVRHINMILHSLATFDVQPAPNVLSKLSYRLTELLSKELSAEEKLDEVVNAFVAYGTLKGGREMGGRKVRAALGPALLKRASEVLDSLDSRKVSRLLWAAASLDLPVSGELASRVAKQAGLDVRLCSVREMSMMLWAMAKLGVQPEGDLLEEMGPLLRMQSSSMEARNAAIIMWALATMRIAPSKDIQTAILGALLTSPESMSEQDVANVIWSLGKLRGAGQWGIDAWDALKQRSIAIASEASPQHCANMLWATPFLVPGKELDQFVAALCVRVRAVGQEMEPRQVSMALIGLGKLGVSVKRLSYSMHTASNEQMSPTGGQLSGSRGSEESSDSERMSLGPENLSSAEERSSPVQQSTSRNHEDLQRGVGLYVGSRHKGNKNLEWWAGMSWGPQDCRVVCDAVNFLCDRAHALADLLNAQGLSNVLWALVVLGVDGRPELVQKLSNALKPGLASQNPQGIANCLWALCKLGHLHVNPEMLDAIGVQVLRQINEMSPEGLASVAYTYAQFGPQPGSEIAEALERRTTLIASQLKIDTAVGMLLSFSVLQGGAMGDGSRALLACAANGIPAMEKKKLFGSFVVALGRFRDGGFETGLLERLWEKAGGILHDINASILGHVWRVLRLVRGRGASKEFLAGLVGRTMEVMPHLGSAQVMHMACACEALELRLEDEAVRLLTDRFMQCYFTRGDWEATRGALMSLGAVGLSGEPEHSGNVPSDDAEQGGELSEMSL